MKALGLRVRRLAPLAAIVVAGGCFATRSDVRIVQSDLASMRTELLRSDAELREQLTQTIRLIAAVNDSVRALGGRTVAVQGDVRGETRSIREQLIQIQQLLGQSQAALNRWKAEMEQRNAAPVMPPAGVVPPAGDSLATTQPTQPQLGPSQLYTNGTDQFRRSSWATARTYFQELLTTYPTSDYAPDAQYLMAETFAKENNLNAADAAYAAVVAKYPNSPKAPTALYKRARVAAQQGNNTRARELANQVLTKYPRSEEAELVPDFIKSLR